MSALLLNAKEHKDHSSGDGEETKLLLAPRFFVTSGRNPLWSASHSDRLYNEARLKPKEGFCEYVSILLCQKYALVLESHIIDSRRGLSLGCMWWIASSDSDSDSNDGPDADRYYSTYFGTSSDRYGKDR